MYWGCSQFYDQQIYEWCAFVIMNFSPTIIHANEPLHSQIHQDCHFCTSSKNFALSEVHLPM